VVTEVGGSVAVGALENMDALKYFGVIEGQERQISKMRLHSNVMSKATRNGIEMSMQRMKSNIESNYMQSIDTENGIDDSEQVPLTQIQPDAIRVMSPSQIASKNMSPAIEKAFQRFEVMISPHEI
jgi:hypothetical protein